MFKHSARSINRRTLLRGSAAVAGILAFEWPRYGSAQQTNKIHRIGILETGAPDPTRNALWDFFKGQLVDLGFVEDQKIVYLFRWAEGRQERLPDGAADLVRQNVDVIVTAGTPAIVAASRATSHVPIVMATGSQSKPESNVVAAIDAPPGLGAKRFDMLQRALPNASSFAILADRGNPSSPPAVQETQEAAKSVGKIVKDYWVSKPEDFKEILGAMKKDSVDAFVIAPGAMFFAHQRLLTSLALEYRLASMSVRKEYAEAGRLLSYGAPIRDNYRQAAMYVDRILRGAKPSELPVFEPKEFELVINVKTAQALGLSIPQPVLDQAQKVS